MKDFSKRLSKPLNRLPGSGSHTHLQAHQATVQASDEDMDILLEDKAQTSNTATPLNSIHEADDLARIQGAIPINHERLQSLSPHSEVLVNVATCIEPTIEDAGRSYEFWEPVMEKLNIFASIINSIGDLHPYAKMITTAISLIVEPVIDQDKRDQAIVDLLEAMDSLYGLVNKTDCIAELEQYRKGIIKDMSTMTEDCARFIRDELRFTSFWMRAGSNVLSGSNVDKKLHHFIEAFKDLRRSFIEAGVIETQIEVENFAEQSITGKLPYISGAGLDSSKACLEGTRVKTLSVLRDWVDTPTACPPRVLFLLGGPGTGKSSIAHAIGKHFNERRRLGSLFSFDRSFQGNRPLTRVLPTIAHDLANWNPTFRRELASVLRNKSDMVGSIDIARQWQSLIVEPLKKVTAIRPYLIVIDAFDECSAADAPERRRLLELLAKGVHFLPSTIRILITSRSDHDLKHVTERHCAHMLFDDDHTEARRDIRLFVRHELTPADPAYDKPLEDADIDMFAERAEGLFQWAATACRVIREKPIGCSLKKQYDQFMKKVPQGGSFTLDDIYRTVLGELFSSEDDCLMGVFRSVMSLMLCASYPLSIESLDEIHSLAGVVVEEHEIARILRGMGSLLSGVDSLTTPVRPHHTSFSDFLTDESRSRVWCVKSKAGHPIMALGCIRVMNTRLSFNMCGLESSYLRNCATPGLDVRVSEHVPQSLSYAACNWKSHLPGTVLPSTLQKELDAFLKEKLLFWFELLSLLDAVNCARSSLEAALASYDDSAGESCKELLVDAITFIRFFGAIIALSAPHVYLSALTFSPTSSKVRTNYIKNFPSLPLIHTIHDHWPQARTVLRGHTNYAMSVAYSPDGRYIVSGSGDQKVIVWDAESGESVMELLSCGWVCGVAFSPDGQYITAARIGGLSIWDASTGDHLVESDFCETVQSFAYSPDGCYVVLGDEEGRIYMWSTKTHKVLWRRLHDKVSFGAFDTHFVRAVAFSPDGQYVASGGDTEMVRVWKARNGKPVGKPLEGHRRLVLSLLFSLNGLWIISGSEDSTIRIWDFKTQQTLHTIRNPYGAAIASLSLSRDGIHIVSGCKYGDMFVLNLDTREVVGGLMAGHSQEVTSVSFSPDGLHIASCSYDGSVLIWLAGENVATESEAGLDASRITGATVVAFSPDGSRILSGTHDGQLHVWDANTGQHICTRLKLHRKRIRCIKFSPDGRRFLVQVDYSKRVREWDALTLKPLRKPLGGRSHFVRAVDYSPGARRIVSGAADGTLRIWTAETHVCLRAPLVGHQKEVTCVAWSPDGKYIASGSEDMTIRLWLAGEGRAFGEPLRGHTHTIISISWSIDNRYLMSHSFDGTYRFWSLQHQTASFVVYRNKVPPYIYCQQIGPWGSEDSPQANPIAPIVNKLYRRDSYQNTMGMASSSDGGRILSWSNERMVVWDAFTDPSGAHPTFVGCNVRFAANRALLSYPQGWNGWVEDEDNNLVIWIPEEYRQSVLWRGMIMVLGREALTVDFSNASYGAEWANCYKPRT